MNREVNIIINENEQPVLNNISLKSEAKEKNNSLTYYNQNDDMFNPDLGTIYENFLNEYDKGKQYTKSC